MNLIDAIKGVLLPADKPAEKNQGSGVDRTPLAVNKNLSDIEFLEEEIRRWKLSPGRLTMFEGERYYSGKHDILKRERMAIGEGGKLEKVENLPNNRIVDNQYGKMVDQKTNYLLGQPLTFESDDKAYVKALNDVFDKKFHRTLKALGESALNCGIAWLYPYYNDEGDLDFMRFEPFEILPLWADAEHTRLDIAVRVYVIDVYEGKDLKQKELVEVYYSDRVEKYELRDNKLIPDSELPIANYVIYEDEEGQTGYSWGKVPLIPFKYNNQEIPLIRKVKSLQDGINLMLSDFMNNMQEDARNTILVLKNYDGEDLGTFRKNLSEYGAVKVRTVDGADGGVDTLTVTVNSDNYKAVLELFKKALIENAMGYDAKDDRLNGQPNQMNIQSMYSDIDLDANNMETEFQAAFETLLEFLDLHFAGKGIGNFENSDVRVIFNRDMMMNESEVIDDCAKSVGIISDETIIAQHPWVEDVDSELKKLDKQKKAAEEQYNPFKAPADDDEQDPKKDDKDDGKEA